MGNFKTKLIDGIAWRLFLYGSSFLLNVCISRFMGAEHAGSFYLLINNLSYIIILATFGLDGALSYYKAREEITAAQLFSFTLAWAGIVVVIVCVAMAYLKPELNMQEKIAVGFYITGYVIANLLSALLYAIQKHKMHNIIYVSVNVFLIIAAYFSLELKALETSLFKIIYLYSGALLAVLSFIYMLVLGILPVAKIPPFAVQAKLYSFALRSFIFTMAYALFLRFDYWLVAYYCTPEALGNFIQTSKLNQVIMFLPMLASFSLFPLLVKEMKADRPVGDKIYELINFYLFTGIVLSIPLALFGYWLFPIVYGESFSEMYVLFLILIPGLICLSATHPLSTYFTGRNELLLNVLILIGCNALAVLLDLWLIPILNIKGAALVSSFGYVLYFLCLLWRFSKKYPGVNNAFLPSIFTQNIFKFKMEKS